MATDEEVIRELNRAKAAFQLRAITLHMGLDTSDQPGGDLTERSGAPASVLNLLHAERDT